MYGPRPGHHALRPAADRDLPGPRTAAPTSPSTSRANRFGSFGDAGHRRHRPAPRREGGRPPDRPRRRRPRLLWAEPSSMVPRPAGWGTSGRRERSKPTCPPEPIAVIGAGSVGCMLGAHLAAAGCDHHRLRSDARWKRLEMTIDGEPVEGQGGGGRPEPADLPPLGYAVAGDQDPTTPPMWADWLGALPAGSVVARGPRTGSTPLAPHRTADRRRRPSPMLVYPNAERTGPRAQVRVAGRCRGARGPRWTAVGPGRRPALFAGGRCGGRDGGRTSPPPPGRSCSST